jgi:hypothetical protein
MPTPATLLNELLKDDRTDKAGIVGKLNQALFLPAQIICRSAGQVGRSLW